CRRPLPHCGTGKLPAGRWLGCHSRSASALYGWPDRHRRPLMALRILITNDDGVDAPGIAIMAQIAAALSDDVWIVAPDGNQSGAGHRLTFGRELALVEHGPRRLAVVGGSPAACVVAGMTHILRDRPADLVLSGLSAGQDLGDIVN